MLDIGSNIMDEKPIQGSTLTVNRWPKASKKSEKQLRTNKKLPQLVLQGL